MRDRLKKTITNGRTMCMVMLLTAVSPAVARAAGTTGCWPLMLGVGVGPMVNGDLNGGESLFPVPGGGMRANLDASVDVPLAGAWGARVDAGRVTWAFQDTDYFGRVLDRADVRLKRLTVGAMKAAGSRGGCAGRVRIYGGGGAGIYWYEFGEGDGVKRAGMHLFAGVDTFVTSRVAVAVHASLHDINGPDRSPLSGSLFAMQLSIGVKWML